MLTLNVFRKGILYSLSSIFFLFIAPHGQAFVDDLGWSALYVEELFDAGGMSGYEDGTFRPHAFMNRAEVAKVAVWEARRTGVIQNTSLTSTGMIFSDVSSDKWYYEDIMLGQQSGIFEGYRDKEGNLLGIFNPSGLVTRAEAAKIFMKASGMPYYVQPLSPFQDVPSSSWYSPFVTTMYNFSVMDGYKDVQRMERNYFGPGDFVTRGQIAKIAVNSEIPTNRYPGFCANLGYPVVENVCNYPEGWTMNN